MSAHTKGPWIIHAGLQGYRGDVFSPTAKAVKDCHHIARCFAPKPSKQPLDELQLRQATNEAISVIEANARLIAAAPELLDALRECNSILADLTSGTPDPSGADIIAHYERCVRAELSSRKAIAKAVQS